MARVFEMDRLSTCFDISLVDGILDDIGVPIGVMNRVIVLYQYMRIERAFTCGEGLSEDEEYSLAKQHLVFMNESRIINKSILSEYSAELYV